MISFTSAHDPSKSGPPSKPFYFNIYDFFLFIRRLGTTPPSKQTIDVIFRYKIDGKLVFIRMLKNKHVMVRVGTVNAEYLD